MKWITPKRVIIFVAILLVGFIGWRWYAGKQAAKAAIKTATVTKKEVISSITSSGKVNATKMAILNFPVSGKLGFVNVKNDDPVKTGQTLAGLDVADLDTTISKAWNTYLAYDAAAKLAEDSVKGHDGDETFAQKNTRVAAQTARDTAYDTWLAAVRAKQNSYLVSPLNGFVTATTISTPGDTVGVTDGITVADPTSLRFQGEIDETDVGKVFVGMPVSIKLDAYDGQMFEGAIERIAFSATTSSTGGTVYLVDVKLSDADTKKMRMGMNGDVTIVLQKTPMVLALPVDSVVDGKVSLMDGSKKSVETGVVGDTLVEIKSGLNEGDVIVMP